ncbi:UNVERIFIED_ORG: hypothetical protein J2X79_004216 [Arthrobacter globiformis]|nr:hypothetical protein [Arthrobacter globiformis]
MNTQPRTKETRTEYLTGHVGRPMNAHEQVTSTKTANQGTKEAAGHSTGHQ